MITITGAAGGPFIGGLAEAEVVSEAEAVSVEAALAGGMGGRQVVPVLVSKINVINALVSEIN